MKSQIDYWPFNRVEPSTIGLGLARYVAKSFKSYSLDLLEYLEVNDRPFNTKSELQRYLARFHEKLENRFGFELYALALIANGAQPMLQVRDRHYEGGTVYLIEEILEANLSDVVIANPGCDPVSLFKFAAEPLYQAAVDWMDEPPKTHKFSFDHEQYIRVIRGLAYTQHEKQHAENLLTKARDGLDSAILSTFALAGYPSTEVLVAASKSLLSFRSKIDQPSRALELDYVMSLVNNSYFRTLAGADVVDTVQELERRLQTILPILYPTFDPLLHTALVRNLMGHILAHYPEHWPAFSFEAKELLGPSRLELKPHVRDEGPSFAGVSEGFLSRRLGEAQKSVTTAMIKAHPELLDARNITRLGTCCNAWKALDNDYTSARQEINELKRLDIWHYLFAAKENVSVMDEDNCLKAVHEYLEKGGNAYANAARTAIDKYPTLVDRVVCTLKNRKPAERLAALCPLTPQQIASLPLELRGVVFSTDLGL